MRNIYFGRGIKFMPKQKAASMLLAAQSGHALGRNVMKTANHLMKIQGSYADDLPSDKQLNPGLQSGKGRQISKLRYRF